jgi:hypothetical protein
MGQPVIGPDAGKSLGCNETIDASIYRPMSVHGLEQMRDSLPLFASAKQAFAGVDSQESMSDG